MTVGDLGREEAEIRRIICIFLGYGIILAIMNWRKIRLLWREVKALKKK
jgi:hypothetical protein